MSGYFFKPAVYGLLAAAGLAALNFTVVGLISGSAFAAEQFARYWQFIAGLAAGFGIQIGLYSYLRKRIAGMHGEGKVLGVTGTASTAAMISCCAHYLANLLPILGTFGIVTFVAQYQIKLFWIGLFFNLAGIAYIASRIIKFQRA